MECKGVDLFHVASISYVVIQVQMGILPVGRATTLLPAKPPTIS